MNLLFLDTETTGAMPGKDRLCSIAYKVDGQLHHEFFKPPLPIAIDAMAVHHVTNEMVADKPAFAGSETYQKLSSLLQDHILVAHNAPFDIAMLQAEGLQVPNFICTYRVARGADPEGIIPRYGLQYLRYFLKLNVADAPAHSAAGDVMVLEELFKRLEPKMSQEEMMKISREPILFRHFNFGKYNGQAIADIARTDRGYLQWLLEQKRQSAGSSKYSDEADWIHTLSHYLA
jgi:DNA polymerase III epsilon subunit-like protein